MASEKNASKREADTPAELPLPARRSSRAFYLTLVILLLVGLGLSVYASPIGQAWRQKQEIESLDRLQVASFRPPSRIQEFLLDYLPEKGVLTPMNGFAEEPLTQADLEFLRDYPEWASWDLTIAAGSDRAIRESLARSVDLEGVSLDGQFTSAAIPPLDRHHKLRVLDLFSETCGDSVLPAVCSAPALVSCGLGSAITDEGLVELLQSTALRELLLYRCVAITDAPFLAVRPVSLGSSECYSDRGDRRRGASDSAVSEFAPR